MEGQSQEESEKTQWAHGYDSEQYPLLPKNLDGDVHDLRRLHRAFITEHYRERFLTFPRGVIRANRFREFRSRTRQ